MKVKYVKKRSGKIVKFDKEKITEAIFKAAQAVGGRDRELSAELADKVVDLLKEDFRKKIPTVEDVQNKVEKVLIENGHAATSKSYILYREQHKNIRETTKLLRDIQVVDEYVKELDWRVRENSNMTYSLQGLNVNITEKVISNYWLNNVYPKEIRRSHLNGDFHIHDLGTLGAYCVGWDLQDLIKVGFKGVRGKIESKPPKHFDVALMQLVNFLYTLQGEAAGAQAVSNFDTLLAPFIKYDGLNEKQVKQSMQKFLFNMNVPTRVGFQCLSADTKILTPKGWKSYSEVDEGSLIYTFNLDEGKIEEKEVDSVFKRKYKGKMYNLRNRTQNQLISPKHRVIRKAFNENKYILESIEEVLKLGSPVPIPVSADNKNKDYDVSDEKIKLLAWIISEGSIENSGSYRVSIYQKKGKNYEDIKKLLDHFEFDYDERDQKGLGESVHIRLKPESSKEIHKWFDGKVKKIPRYMYKVSKRQAGIFIDTYVSGDGWKEKYRDRITTTDKEILEGLEAISVLAGFNFITRERDPPSEISKKLQYILSLTNSKTDYIQEIKKVDYEDIIWSVHTENETVIAKRKGQVFFTGNTPFTNLTLDLKYPKYMANENVVIGGKLRDETYKDFQEEIELVNRVFADVMLKGDAKGRPFTFPIPTYNISKDFDWNNENYDGIWKMTAKYGIPYFANFVNSDMEPDDARSMCPLSADEKVLIRSSRGRNLEYSKIGNVYGGNSKQEEYEIFSDGQFVKGKFNKFENQRMIKVTLENNHEIKMSDKHLNFVIREKGKEVEELKGEELKEGMYLPYSLETYEGNGGVNELGYFVGAYAGDGSLDGQGTVVFSLGKDQKEVVDKIKEISNKYFNAHASTYESKGVIFLRVHSKSAVGLCKDYVKDKEREKHYLPRLFGSSKEFREGVVQGHLDTDGGNRNRIYTSSKKMVNSLNMLAATLGTTTSIYEDNREGRYGKEPNYAVLIYKLNREKYGKGWFKKDKKLWVGIKSIEKINNSTAYCFEVANGEPVFTVGSTGILTHNCRLRLDKRELKKRGGGLFGSNPLTGSIGVVTMNIPRLAYKSKSESQFFENLGSLMDKGMESLLIKRELLERFTEQGLYPYSKFYLRNIKKAYGEYWKNHFSTIGLIGMNDALINLMKSDISQKEGKKFAEKVLNYMRDRLADYQQETGDIFNLEATPGEGTSYRLARIDKRKYPGIKVFNQERYSPDAEPYYTNSTQLPVGLTDDMFKALRMQDSLQSKYTGGTVLHGFIGESMPNIESVKTLVKNIAHNFHLPYYTITPTFSICPVHGYLSGEHEYCPKCDEELKIVSRGGKVEKARN